MEISLKTTPEQEIYNILQKSTKELGFDYFAYDVEIPWPVGNHNILSFNNYPPAWQARYLQLEYKKLDPTAVHRIHSLLPFKWPETRSPFWDDVRAHGLCGGWSQRCISTNGLRGHINLSNEKSTRIPSSDYLPMKILWMAHTTHECLSPLLIKPYLPECPVHLTPKELEALRWTANGKTADEVAKIMHISSRTANFHITNVIQKFDVSNKTAAAIKAVLLGIL